MRAALYARVSTDRQERNQTIDSQLALLSAWIEANSHELTTDHCYRDEGFSGSRLDRPGLDSLRDAVRDREIDVVVVLTPDRLARKFAYQALLLEEFHRAGCEVVFLERPISEDPSDQLLLQIQGAVAEYERALLAERFRRGKLQKARAGQFIGGKAPYGYRYVPRQDGVAGHLVVDETESELVRMLYGWAIQEHLTVRQMVKQLNGGPYVPRSGRRCWSHSVLHHILTDPIYTGTAYVNRYEYVPATKPKRTRSSRSRSHAGENVHRKKRPREQWIAVPVPALIDQETWDLAQAQLARNAQLSFRNNRKHDYLLRCLLTCQGCGLAMHGRTGRASGSQPPRSYYVCNGKDALYSARETVCPYRQVRSESLESAVWEHVAGLLRDPAQLLAQFSAFAERQMEGTAQEQAAEAQTRTRLERLARAEERLVDAYQAEVITLEELAARRQQMAIQRQALEAQHEQQRRLRQQRTHAEEVYADLAAFCERIQTRLESATFAEKQAVLQLVIERIIVGEDTLEIRHVIPLRNPPPGPAGPAPPPIRLRSDRVASPALVVHAVASRGVGPYGHGPGGATSRLGLGPRPLTPCRDAPWIGREVLM